MIVKSTRLGITYLRCDSVLVRLVETDRCRDTKNIYKGVF